MEELNVKRVDNIVVRDIILNRHYAKRLPPLSYSFGLYKGDELVGICTFGKPASNGLCECCGVENKSKVFELSRLYTEENLPKNSLSFFVSRCLKLLKKEDLIIVSYADSGMKHHGYIYQATNWIYTGVTKMRTDKYTEQGKHSRHYKKDLTNSNLRKVRFSKHRYFYFTGKSRRKFKELLKYETFSYPKGSNGNYNDDFICEDIILDKNKNESLSTVKNISYFDKTKA